MAGIIKRSETLPAKINALKDFIAIRRREITAYRAKLRALDDIGLIEKRREVLAEAQDKAEEVLAAEATLGEVLKSSVKGTFKKGGEKSLPKGISKKQSFEVQKINRHWEIAEGFMEEARRKEEIATHTGVLKWINAFFRPDTPSMIEGKFDIILADPPWEYDFSETESRKIEAHYPSMKLQEIENLEIPDSENAVLFLWATAPKLREALKVMIAWKFDYKTHAIWDKETIGMGYWFRGQHELLLVGIKGNGIPPEATNRFSSIIREKRTGHSRKPEEAYKILETMFPKQTKIELFQTKNRIGWTGWGSIK